MTSETKSNDRAAAANGAKGADARQMLDDVAQRAGDAIDRASAQMPAVMETASSALNESARRLEESPDNVLTIGAALSTGIALGLYIGGANRILVTLAMIPAVAMGFTLLGRSSRGEDRLSGVNVRPA
jgi:hypothetical protein